MDEEGHMSVVLHADLDCFYGAVEQVRLGIPTEQPLTVQQWEGLAVNYAARAAGIVRHERLSEALRKGIASNKLLAKIASAKKNLIGKPCIGVRVPPRSVPGLMKDLPLKKIKLLGGKLGEEMKKRWGCTTAGKVQQIPQAALVACFGDMEREPKEDDYLAD